jgi:hypothetical protein
MRRVLGVMLVGCLVPSGVDARWRRPAAPASRRGPARTRDAAPEWPRPEVMRLALRAWECGRSAGLFAAPIVTVIDYSLPSTERRLWVVDLAARRVLFHELVAHGVGSGENFATAFSNDPGSRRSSLGLFRTEDVYRGEHGVSLRLSGLEPDVNDRAMERAIVMHGAAYVSRAVVVARGQLGRSWGCPALERGVDRRVIERIAGGTALFAYYPDARWLRESWFLRCNSAPPDAAASIGVSRRWSGGIAPSTPPGS